MAKAQLSANKAKAITRVQQRYSNDYGQGKAPKVIG